MQDQNPKKQTPKPSTEAERLPPVPDKLYFSISEVGELCNLEPHVLRYWEQEFPSLNPIKRTGNRRYYQQDDIVLIRKIKHLLYQVGYTIEGARAALENKESQNNSGNRTKELLTNIVERLEKIIKE